MLGRRMKKNRKIIILISVLIALSFLIFNFYEKRKLLIAPMIGGLDSCIFKKDFLIFLEPESKYTKLCAEVGDSPAALIESTLQGISDRGYYFGNYKLGYTLYVPVLKLFDIIDSEPVINKKAVHRVVNAIRDVDRSMILYLFSDHFGVDSPVENYLAKDTRNLLKSTKGFLERDKYYGVDIYPWSFVDFDNQITRLRAIAFNEILDEVCKLPEATIKRIMGVTVLGELHHMFPDFQSGMGFSGEYLISDYSERSVVDFRNFLSKKYHDIHNLNSYLNSNYANFEEINPPSKNIRKQSLSNYWEHIDAYAHGVLPISGWVAATSKKSSTPLWIKIYQNGEFLARVPVAFGRQDVLLAHPELRSPDVGWSFDFNYANLSSGIYTIDIFLENPEKPLMHLSTRHISIIGQSQLAPVLMPLKALPDATVMDHTVLSYVDYPQELSSYYYNPLAVLWLDFRRNQITKYLHFFENIAKSKCINSDFIYSHQILPFVNPGWDVSKFAVGNDLSVPATMRLGVSLYGEASYGTSFFDWYSKSNRKAYGITEFHPLKAMNPVQLDAVLDKHYKNNAQFLSFFTEAKGLEESDSSTPNIFSFSKINKNAGSNVLFESMRELLK